MHIIKSHTRILFYLCFSLFLVANFNAVKLAAQEDYGSIEYQQEELPEKSKLSEALKKDASEKYDYRNEKDKKEEQKEDFEPTIEKSREPMFSSEMREILKYSLFGLVILVLSFIAFRLVTGGMNLNNKKVKLGDEVYSIEDIEEKLHEVDVEAFLEQAIAQQDYRLGIRLYYLAILKELSLSGAIEWKKDKTNGVYIREMRGHPQQALFRKTTYIYEYVWFNEDEPFGTQEFEDVRPIFKKMLTTVQPKTTNA
jgi:hypothetical protein